MVEVEADVSSAHSVWYTGMDCVLNRCIVCFVTNRAFRSFLSFCERAGERFLEGLGGGATT